MCSLKKIMKILRIQLNVGSVTMTILIIMLRYKIIVMSMENIEVPHIENVVSIKLN